MGATGCFGSSAFNIDGTVISTVINGFKCVFIESSITEIAGGTRSKYAFQQGKDEITTVDFNNAVNLRIIGDFAFYNCKSIQSIDLTSCTKLEYIGHGAFYQCSSAQNIIYLKTLL